MADDILNSEWSEKTLALSGVAHGAVEKILSANSKKHGGHIEWECRTPQAHLQKAARHCLTALAQLDMNENVRDGEDARAHIERAIVRSAMALSNLDSLSRWC
jgi:hypothetical protein